MKVWKRNAVVAAIVLFVCVAVYLNWSYQSGETADAGKTLGEAALVNGQTSDPRVGGTAASPDPASSASPEAGTTGGGSYFDSARLNRVAIAIMRVAMYEILYMQDIPNAAAINEAVEMTKHYEEPEVVSFVNGILGSFVRNECPPEPVGLKPAAERPQDEA